MIWSNVAWVGTTVSLIFFFFFFTLDQFKWALQEEMHPGDPKQAFSFWHWSDMFLYMCTSFSNYMVNSTDSHIGTVYNLMHKIQQCES